MAILNMRILPDPILRKQAKKVAKVTPQIKKLATDMVETMHSQFGVGLAANQIGSLQKVAVIQTPDMEEPMVLINPEIMKAEGEREVEEGCLSVPGYRGRVNRSEKVRAKAMGLDGKIFRVNADELLAQALEHEIDHLNGILYIDHLVSHESLYKITYGSDDGEDEYDGESDPDGDETEAAGSPVAAETSPSGSED